MAGASSASRRPIAAAPTAPAPSAAIAVRRSQCCDFMTIAPCSQCGIRSSDDLASSHLNLTDRLPVACSLQSDDLAGLHVGDFRFRLFKDKALDPAQGCVAPLLR